MGTAPRMTGGGRKISAIAIAYKWWDWAYGTVFSSYFCKNTSVDSSNATFTAVRDFKVSWTYLYTMGTTYSPVIVNNSDGGTSSITTYTFKKNKSYSISIKVNAGGTGNLYCFLVGTATEL